MTGKGKGLGSGWHKHPDLHSTAAYKGLERRGLTKKKVRKAKLVINTQRRNGKKVSEHRRVIETTNTLRKRALNYDKSNRSKRSRVQDSRLAAKLILPLTERGYATWRKNPAISDLKGIDTKTLKGLILKTKKKIAELKQEVKVITIRRRRARKTRGFEPSRRSAPNFFAFGNFQRQAFLKIADDAGIARDTVDWQAEIDTKLTFNENKMNLQDMLGRKSPSTLRAVNAEIERFERQFEVFASEMMARGKALVQIQREI